MKILVMHQKMRRMIARTMNAPTNPSAATERYQTPIRSLTGQRGNMTPASMTATMAMPPMMVQRGDPS